MSKGKDILFKMIYLLCFTLRATGNFEYANVGKKKINNMFLRHTHFENFYCISSIHIEKLSIHRKVSV